MQQKSIKSNTILNAIKTFSTLLFPLITIPYINRTLLAENVGKVNFGLSIVSYFSMIASLGITTYAIRECSAARNDKNKLSDTASQIFSINMVMTVFAYILLAVTLIFMAPLENYRALIVIQSLSILFTTLGTDWLNSAMEDFKFITLRTIAFQVIALVLMFVFVRAPEHYMRYAAITLVSGSGANVINIWYRRRYCNVRFTTAIQWKKHLTPVVLMFAMILSQNIMTNIDSTMLGLMHGDRAVGIYGTAQKINSIVSQVVSSVLWVIMPRMSFYFQEKNYSEISRLLRKLLGFNLLMGLPCAVGLMLLADDVILLIAGPDFIEAADVLRIRTLSFVFALIGGNLLGNAVLLPSKQEKYYMIICCIVAVINAVTNYICIPDFGAMGAAATTAFCSLCMLVLLVFKVDRNIRLKNISNLVITPLIGCAGIAVVCTLLSGIDSFVLRVTASITASVAVYGLIQLLLKNELVSEVVGSVLKKVKKRKEGNQ